MVRVVRLFCLFCLTLVFTASLQASLVAVTTNLDAHDIVLNGTVEGNPPFAPAYSFDLAAGDELRFTILFPGQQVTLTNVKLLWAFFLATAGPGSEVNGTGTMTLLDTNGVPIYTSPSNTDTELSFHFGQSFFSADLAGLPNPITFGGLRYDGTLNFYSEPGLRVRTYGIPALWVAADSISVASAVPEPASVVLVCLGALAFVVRRTSC